MENKKNLEVSEFAGNTRLLPTDTFGKRISTILAAIGLAVSPNILAQTPIQFSAPVKISGSGTETFSSETGKSRILVPHVNSRTETTTQMTLSISPLQAGPYGGNLTVSGVMRIVSGDGGAYAGVGITDMFTFIEQQVFHGSGQEIRRIGDPNGDGFWNDSNPVFNGTGEGIDQNRSFSYTIPVSSSGLEYTIQNSASVSYGEAVIMLAGDIDGTAPISAQYTPYQTDPDENDNGIFDDWEREYFGNADQGVNRPKDDADHDGMSNLEEYALNQDPLSHSVSQIQYIINKNYTLISGGKNVRAPNVTYIPEVSTDLVNWSSTDPKLHDTSNATSFYFMDMHQSLTEKRFYRIRIEAK